MAKNEQVSKTFSFLRETPGTYVTQEIDADGAKLDSKNGALVGTLYLRKDQMPNGQPKKVIAHLEFIY